MKKIRELENVRGLLDLADSVVGGVFSLAGVLFMLWVLILFPAALIYAAWPWISMVWEWLRDLLTFV